MNRHRVISKKRSGNFKRKVRKHFLRIINTSSIIDTVEDARPPETSSVSTTADTTSFQIFMESQNSKADDGDDSTTLSEILEESQNSKSDDDDDGSLCEGSEDLEFRTLETSVDTAKDLRMWSLKHKIKHVALKDLLDILNKRTTLKLPKDPRSLLHTPSDGIQIKNIKGGQYWHYGFEVCLRNFFHDVKADEEISIKINIDGLPIFNSSKNEFWPIIFTIDNLNPKPMIIGIYYGKGKPQDLCEFLSPLVEELDPILRQGLKINDYNIAVTLKCFVCDSPARSFIKGVANFNSQHGCHKCSIEGEYSHVSHTNYYPNKIFPKRTNDTFRNKEDEYHHKIDSPVLKLPINMIDTFPVADSLHLIDLGIVKRLLTAWRDGYFKNKFLKWPSKTIDELSLKMQSIKLPQELHRNIRGLDCLSFWKALEYRNFLLYYGIVVLKGILRSDVYEHFLILFCAITICSTDHYKRFYDVANKLLIHFVDQYCIIYGEHYLTSNVHNLIHLTEDVQNLGNLTKFSAYPFESKLYEIKNMLRSGNKPLAQIANRLIEIQKAQYYVQKDMKSDTYPQLKYVTSNSHLRHVIKDNSSPIYKRLVLESVTFGGKEENSWILTKNNRVVRVNAFCKVNEEFIFSGKEMKHCSEFFRTPIDSTKLNIFCANVSTVHSNDLMSFETTFELSNIKCKLVRVSCNDHIVFIPLLHTLST